MHIFLNISLFHDMFYLSEPQARTQNQEDVKSVYFLKKFSEANSKTDFRIGAVVTLCWH